MQRSPFLFHCNRGVLLVTLAAGSVAHAGEPAVLLDPSPEATDQVVIPDSDTHAWILGGGLLWRNVGEIRFRSGPGAFELPSTLGSAGLTLPAGIGPSSGPAFRDYDDGFVHPDSRTPALGRTTNYGYQAPSQLEDGHLHFTASGGERREITRMQEAMTSTWKDDRDGHLAPYLKLGHLIDLPGGWQAGPVLHFTFSSIEASQHGSQTFSALERLDRYSLTAHDRYDHTGLTLPLAPYQGGPDLVAPLLPAEPAERTFEESLAGTQQVEWRDSIAEDLDLDLFGLSIGGEANFHIRESVYGAVGAGFVLNVADWEASRRDVFIQTTPADSPLRSAGRTQHETGSSILWGAYVQALAGVQLSEELSLEAHFRYDWNEDLSGKVGDSSFRADLSGFSVGLGARYRFW